MKNLGPFLVCFVLLWAPVVHAQPQASQSYHQGDACIDVPNASYAITVERGPDFDVLDINQGDRLVANVYVGNFPQGGDDKLAAAQRAHQAFVAMDTATPHRQFIAASGPQNTLFLHVMFAEAVTQGEQQSILHGVRFCHQ